MFELQLTYTIIIVPFKNPVITSTTYKLPRWSSKNILVSLFFLFITFHSAI